MNILEKSDALDKKLAKAAGINKAVEGLIDADRRRKRQVRLLAISLALDILLTFGFAYVAARAESNEQALSRSCQTSNEARSKNREIWNYVLELSNRPNQTAQQQADRENFIAKLNETFAPRECK